MPLSSYTCQLDRHSTHSTADESAEQTGSGSGPGYVELDECDRLELCVGKDRSMDQAACDMEVWRLIFG